MAYNPYLPGLEPINTMNNPVWNPDTQQFEYGFGNSAKATQPGLPGWDIYDKPGLPSGYPGTEGSLNKRYASVPEGMRETISDATIVDEYNAPNYMGARSPITYPNQRFERPLEAELPSRRGTTSGMTYNLGFPTKERMYDPAFGGLSQRDEWDTSYPGSFEKRGGYNDLWEIPRLWGTESEGDFYRNFQDQGITGLDVQETMSPDEDTITAEEWRLPQRDFGPVKRTRPQAGPNKFDRFLQRFGAPAMTQVTAADKLANKQFMTEQGIGRDPQTGRMIGGDFEGMNAPGTSGWGSANFGEMAQNWMDDYGDVEYSIGAIGDMKRKKQARMKQAAKQFRAQQEVQRQERIRNQRAAASAANQMTQRDPTGGGASGRHMGNISQAQASQVAAANAAAGMGGWGLAHGGRVGYNEGGRVGILSIF